LARQLLDAIAHVHAAGIVHRDIKPANIMLDEQGNAHLTDFGIAHSKDAPSLTQTGMVIGTLKYLAPEISAGQPASPASDLYSVGMVLREVAGANPPPNMAQLIGALTHPDPARRASSASSASALLSEQSAPGIVTAPTRAMMTPATRLLTPSAPARVATTTHSCRQRPQPTPKAPSAHRLMALAAIAALVLVVLALVFTLSGGDNGSSNVNPSAARDQPARAQAPLSEQLRALDRIVEHARGR
jgi:serine/threonine-protein kinase